jgi:hypothetical protein
VYHCRRRLESRQKRRLRRRYMRSMFPLSKYSCLYYRLRFLYAFPYCSFRKLHLLRVYLPQDNPVRYTRPTCRKKCRFVFRPSRKIEYCRRRKLRRLCRIPKSLLSMRMCLCYKLLFLSLFLNCNYRKLRLP